MVARRLISTLVVLQCASWAGATVLTPPEIPVQPILRSIHRWGDQIAVIADRRQLTAKYANVLSVVDPSTWRLVPIQVPGCDAFHDVAHGTELGQLLVCGTGSAARVHRMSGTSWHAISEPLLGSEFRFAVDGRRIAVVSEGIVSLMTAAADGDDQRAPVKFKMPARSAPAALLLASDVLLAAYDQGEFGGALYRMDLKRPDRRPERLIDGNVGALARANSGLIWAAGGLSHLGSVGAALYRIGDDGPRTVAAIRGYAGGGQREQITASEGVRFPGLTSLDGLALGKDDRPVVVLSDHGVFELAGERFVALYEGPLAFSYQMPGYTMNSSPVGLARGKSGELYVADRSLGIFVLRQDGNRYSLKQLLFDDPAPDKPSSPAR